MVDATAVTARGTPLVRLRNVDAAEGEPLNAATIRPLRPLLVMRAGADGAHRLTPVNVVSRWRWLDRADGAEVPYELVTRAWRDGDRYAPEVVRALDADGDGALSPTEARLDTPRKAELIAARLRTLGVADPIIDGVLETHVVTHGIPSRELALSECGACHAADSRLDDTFQIAAYLPGGVPPRPPPDGARVELAGVMAPTPSGGLAYRRDPAAAHERHVRARPLAPGLDQPPRLPRVPGGGARRRRPRRGPPLSQGPRPATPPRR